MKAYTFLLFALIALNIQGQEITGKVIDEQSQPVEFASVALYSLSDSTLITGTVTNGEGVFSLNAPANVQNQFLKISFVGYETQTTTTQTEQTITLKTDTKMLGEVVVKGNRKLFKVDEGKITATVQNTVLEQLGSASEVLSQLPFVNETNNSFSVFGRGTPLIYINNQKVQNPDELLRLSSKDIKNVELLLNPGVQYDAGTKSVIKITTIRKNEGISISLASRNEFRKKFNTNQNIRLNYRTGNWDFFTRFGFSKYETESSIKNIIEFTGQNANFIEQNLTHNLFQRTYSGNAGLNYSDSKTSAGVKIDLIQNPKISNNLMGDVQYRTDNSPLNSQKLETSALGKKLTSHLNLYYHRTIDENTFFQFDGDYLKGNPTTHSTAKTDNNSDVISNNHINYNLYAGKMQMMQNVFSGNLNYGVDFSFTHNHQTYDMSGFESTTVPTRNDDLLKQFLGAFFATYSFELNNFSFELGGRYEHLDFRYFNSGVLLDEQSKKFNNLFPFLQISYDADNGMSVSASYTTSIVRPTYNQLSSSIMYVDGYTFQGGNSLLKPSYENRLTSLFSWKDLIAEISYSRYNMGIMNISKLYNNQSSVLFTLENINSFDELFGSIAYSPTFGVWKPVFEVGLIKPFLTYGEQTYNKPYFSYDWNNLIKLSKNLLFSFNLWGTSDGNSYLNYFKSVFRADAGINASFLDNKLNVMLRYSDIFRSDREWWSRTMNGILIDKYSSRDTNGISIQINYSLNPRSSKYKGTGAGASEINRL